MKKAAAATAAAVKSSAKKKSPKPTIPATPVDSIRDVRSRRALQSACGEARDYQNQISALNALKEDLIVRVIGPTIERLKLQKVSGEGWLLLRQPPQKRLSKTKLLEFGVPMRTIEKATVATGKVSYRLMGRKDEESEREGGGDNSGDDES